MKNKILVIHGPNINLLGNRETQFYGKVTLREIEAIMKNRGKQLGFEVDSFQTNHEGLIVDAIQKAKGKYDGLVINPAAYTHTGIAIRDAITAVSLPVVEIHLSNIYTREEFRHHSHIAPVAIGQITGFGPDGYVMAVEALIRHLLGGGEK